MQSKAKTMAKRSKITRDLHTPKYRKRIIGDKRKADDKAAARKPIKKDEDK
jgi:hypothetical protein